jgi:hypothetical protein
MKIAHHIRMGDEKYFYQNAAKSLLIQLAMKMMA